MNNIIIELKVVVDDADDRCDRCHLNGMFDTVLCPNSAERLTGVNCHETGIFKRPEKWQTCTKKNTKVGDEVRLNNDRHQSTTVEHILKDSRAASDCIIFSGWSFPSSLSRYEININR